MKTSATPWLWILQLNTGATRNLAWILISPLDIIGDAEVISVRTLILLSVISAAFPRRLAEAK